MGSQAANNASPTAKKSLSVHGTESPAIGGACVLEAEVEGISDTLRRLQRVCFLRCCCRVDTEGRRLNHGTAEPSLQTWELSCSDSHRQHVRMEESKLYAYRVNNATGSGRRFLEDSAVLEQMSLIFPRDGRVLHTEFSWGAANKICEVRCFKHTLPRHLGKGSYKISICTALPSGRLPCFWEQRRTILALKPRCSSLPRIRRIHAMEPNELVTSMRSCAVRQLLMREVWEAFMYRACVLRSHFTVHQQVQIFRIFASIQRREWCFLNYILDDMRLRLHQIRLADATLLLAALVRLRLKDDMLQHAIQPILMKRIASNSPSSILALLAYTIVRSDGIYTLPLLHKIHGAVAPLCRRLQDPQSISLLLSAYSSYALIASVSSGKRKGGDHDATDGLEVDDGQFSTIPFKAFLELLLQQAKRRLPDFRATDCLHICVALVNIFRMEGHAAASLGDAYTQPCSIVKDDIRSAVLHRILDIPFDFSSSELAHITREVAAMPGSELQQRVLDKLTKELGARADDFSATSARDALESIRLLPQPAPGVEASLLMRLAQTCAESPALAVANVHVLRDVACRMAQPSTLGFSHWLPSLVHTTSQSMRDTSTSIEVDDKCLWRFPAAARLAHANGGRAVEINFDLRSRRAAAIGFQMAYNRAKYRLPAASCLALAFVRTLKAASLSVNVASNVTRYLAQLLVRDARWAFTLQRMGPMMARATGAMSSVALAHLACGLAGLGMPKTADALSLFPLLSSRSQWNSSEGPLAILQAAALFDLTSAPKTLKAEYIIPAAEELMKLEDLPLSNPAVLGFLGSSPLLRQLPEPLGQFFRGQQALRPPCTLAPCQRLTMNDILDGVSLQQLRGVQVKPETNPTMLHRNQSFQQDQFNPIAANSTNTLPIETDDLTAHTKPFSARVYETISSWPQVKITSAVFVGSWAYADLAVDLKSLALHMQAPNTSCKEGTAQTDIKLQVESNIRILNHSDKRPPCYVCSDSGGIARDDSISPETHVLVILLLEDYDFFLSLPHLQRLGTHRTKQTLIVPPTLARIRALRLWGWPVICIRERDWLAAEIEDSHKCSGHSSYSDASCSRHRLFFSTLAKLASINE